MSTCPASSKTSSGWTSAPGTAAGKQVNKVDTQRFRVRQNQPLKLTDFPTREDGGLQREDAEKEFKALRKKLRALQELHYAERKRGMLVALQGMDTSGKDSTIRTVFSGVGPAGVNVVSFKKPSTIQREHDYLWRIHPHTPRDGRTVIFNRSHYEDVLIVRVENLVPETQWQKRYQQINDFSGQVMLETLAWVPGLAVSSMSGLIAASFIPDEVSGLVTVPLGRLVEMAATVLIMIVMMSMGTGMYQIYGKPFDYIHAVNKTEAYASGTKPWDRVPRDITNDFV